MSRTDPHRHAKDFVSSAITPAAAGGMDSHRAEAGQVL
jgi:hypothetical protein